LDERLISELRHVSSLAALYLIAFFVQLYRWFPSIGRARLNTSCVIGTASTAEAFTRRIRAMGIRNRPTAPRSQWQNGHAERLIGSIRRECLIM
jgi:hypothetical protein